MTLRSFVIGRLPPNCLLSSEGPHTFPLPPKQGLPSPMVAFNDEDNSFLVLSLRTSPQNSIFFFPLLILVLSSECDDLVRIHEVTFFVRPPARATFRSLQSFFFSDAWPPSPKCGSFPPLVSRGNTARPRHSTARNSPAAFFPRA